MDRYNRLYLCPQFFLAPIIFMPLLWKGFWRGGIWGKDLFYLSKIFTLWWSVIRSLTVCASSSYESLYLFSSTFIKKASLMRLRKLLILRFSIFLVLRHFNTISHIVLTTNNKIILLLLHNRNVVILMNTNTKIWYIGYLICDIQRLRTAGMELYF